MNAEAIRSRIVGTLSADANVRRQAELELKSVRIAFFCSFFFLSFLFAFFLFPLFGSHNIQYYAMPYHAILSLHFLSMQSSAQAGKRNSLPISLPPQPSFSCCLNPIFPFLHLYLLRAMCLATKANLYLLHVNRPRVTLASSMYYLTF